MRAEKLTDQVQYRHDRSDPVELGVLVVGASMVDRHSIHNIPPISAHKVDANLTLVDPPTDPIRNTSKTEIVFLPPITKFAGGSGVNIAAASAELGEEVTLVTAAPPPEVLSLMHTRGVDVIAYYPKNRRRARQRTAEIHTFNGYAGDRIIRSESIKRDFTVNYKALFPYKLLILSSIDGNSWPKIYADGVADIDYRAQEHREYPRPLLAVFPGGEQMKAPATPELQFALEKADIFSVDREAAIALLNARLAPRGIHVSKDIDRIDLIQLAAAEYGPDKYISITNGSEGSLLCKRNGQVLALEPYGTDAKYPAGAGNAYEAALTVGIVNGKKPEDAMTDAAINAYFTTLKLSTYDGHLSYAVIDAIRRDSQYGPTVIFDPRKRELEG